MPSVYDASLDSGRALSPRILARRHRATGLTACDGGSNQLMIGERIAVIDIGTNTVLLTVAERVESSGDVGAAFRIVEEGHRHYPASVKASTNGASSTHRQRPYAGMPQDAAGPTSNGSV